MATLVLTAAGAVVAGPVGAAVGATIGQAIDRAVFFKPATREGPRLGDLRLQTSSYGSAIPRLFGTMRVAGTVIWATDLIEHRSRTGGGKNQAATATSSYSASFAVLLSARPILGVGRIWAEGQLLRGAAGDWKAGTGFRLHTGGEDQAPDPLIASAEGALAPAHRGCAYAVFEGLALGDYGNRIPSLTFEVIADEGGVPVGAVAAALADEVTGEVALDVAGFAAAGSDVAGALDTLAAMAGGWWRSDGAGLTLCDGGAARPIADVGVVAGRSPSRSRAVKGADTAAKTAAVAFYDPARDYQTGVQQARRPGPGGRAERIELPAALSAAAAKGIAEAVLMRDEADRTRRRLRGGTELIDVAPGEVVRIAGEDGTWRVREAAVEGLAVTLTLVPLAGPSTAMSPAASGRALVAVDAVAGRTLVAAFEAPALGETALAAPRLLVAATGEGAGWRSANLSWSLDEGASWTDAGVTAAAATIGTVEVPPVAAGPWLVDARSAVEVRLARADMTLGDADAASIDAGANLALVGDELIQFARAEPLGAGRWRLTSLRRGLRGTEAAIGGQAAGDRFVLIEADAVRAIDLPLAAIGRSVRVMVWGIGDEGVAATATAAVTGISVAPPSPVRPFARVRTDGALAIGWTRRSRTGWRWVDGVDAPLGEETEAYAVRVEGEDGGVVERIATAAALVLPAAELPPAVRRVTVRQRGTLALSAPAVAMI